MLTLGRSLARSIAARLQRLSAPIHWGKALAAGRAPREGIHVSCGVPEVPGRDEEAHGGMVRYQRMQEEFPNRPYDYNILCLASSTLPHDWRQQVWITEKKGAALAWNQNGVAYPGWAGEDVEPANEPMREGLHAADHVVYQSQFCKESADHWLGEPGGSWDVIYNAVDTRRFTPAGDSDQGEPLILLLGGHQYERYRVMSAIETFAEIRKTHPNARLVITGDVNWSGAGGRAEEIARQRARELGVTEGIEWRGRYSQDEAPGIYREADVLLHTKYKDPCPAVVIEALASGVPVAYSGSGGVPELVGPKAGIAVEVEDTWERQVPPDPEALAEATLSIAEERTAYAKAARQRAVENFDLSGWIDQHRKVFGGLVEELEAGS